MAALNFGGSYVAEYSAIPARLNGSPIPAVSDVSIQAQRTTNQVPTTDGIKITYGSPKFQASITFKTLNDRADFMRLIGAYDKKPAPHNFGYDLGGSSYSLLRGVPSAANLSSNQDGDASLQLTCMYEDIQDEG